MSKNTYPEGHPMHFNSGNVICFSCAEKNGGVVIADNPYSDKPFNSCDFCELFVNVAHVSDFKWSKDDKQEQEELICTRCARRRGLMWGKKESRCISGLCCDCKEQGAYLNKISDYFLIDVELETESPFTGFDGIIQDLFDRVETELKSAIDNWPPFNSAHEGYGVLLEEVDELWAHVKTKQKNRDLEAMKKEALQVAAMAIRFAHEICNEEGGRK